MSADNIKAGKRGQSKQASKTKQSKSEGGSAGFDLSQLGEVRSKVSLQALEPRVLLDAAGLATGAEMLDQANTDRVDSLVDDVLENKAVAPWAVKESAENKELLEALAAPVKSEIVFIDSMVEGADVLIASFPVGTEIYILDAESDGVEQIASVLEGRNGFDAIHIFSHGRSGTLDLGSTKLTEASMASRHADEMEIIRDALSESADILIYGCDFGANARGVSAVEALARATGADVAASEDLTGNATLGGDWDLEVQSGAIEADIIEALAFAGVLSDTIDAGELASGAGIGTDTVTYTGVDGNVLTLVRTDGQAITSEASLGAGLGRLGTDWQVGDTESYTLTFQDGVDSADITIGFFNNNIDGEEELYDVAARDAAGNIIPGAITFTNLSGVVVGSNHGHTNGVSALSGQGGVGVQVTISVASTTSIYSIEFTRQTERLGQTPASGAFGLVLENLDYQTAQANVAPSIDLDIVSAPSVPGVGDVIDLDFSTAPVVTNDGQTEAVEGAGNGETAVYANVGTINGQAVDLRAVVVSSTAAGVNFSTVGDDANVNVSGPLGVVSDAVVRWELVLTGTDTPVTGDFTILLTDLDQSTAFTNRFERISVDEAEVDGYSLNGATDITAANIGGVITFAPTDIDPGTPGTDPTNAVQLDFSGTSSFTITYERSFGGNFTLDGNFAAGFFTNPSTIDTNPDYGDTFTEGQVAVSIAANDMSIVDDGQLAGAIITLTNAQADDLLNVPTGAGLPAGIIIDPASTATNIILTGLASTADYETAIKAITFENTSTTPEDTVVRNIDIQVTDDGGQTSNVASTSINVIDAPTDTDGDGIADIDDIDDDNDGILDVDEGGLNFNEIADVFNIAGDASRISATEVQLTPDANSQAGTIMSFNQISLSDDFTFTYEIFLGDETSAFGGADGITFILHNDPAGSNAVGLAGGGIGATGIQDGVFIEFDTFNNTAFGASNSNDIAGDHTQIRDTDNGFNDAAGAITGVTNLGQLEDSAWHQVSVSWDVATSTLSYLIDGVAMASYIDPNIANTRFGGSNDVYFGFTASTGGATNDQRIRDVTFNGSFSDTDNDGVADAMDRDSDNDGISDLIESGASAVVIAADTNNDGSISLAEAAAANGGVADADGDGLMDIFDANVADTSAAASVGTGTINTDSDGVADVLDLDSDNDGIADAVEARPTAGYVTPTGPVDANGVNATGLFVPEDTDNDGTADYLDTDSDDDGLLDSAESGLTPGADGNGDGIGDGVGASYADPDGVVNNPSTDLANEFGDTSEVGYREVLPPPVLDLNSVATSGDTDRDFAPTFTEGGSAVNITDIDAGTLEASGDGIGFVYITPGNLQDGADEVLNIAGIVIPLNADMVSSGITIPGTSAVIDIAYVSGVITITEQSGGTLSAADVETLLQGITYENLSVAPTLGAGTERTFDIQFARYDQSTVLIDFEELTPGTRASAAELESDPWWGGDFGGTGTSGNGFIYDAANPGPFTSALAAVADGTFIFHNTGGNIPGGQDIVYGRSGIPVTPSQSYEVSVDLGRQNNVSAGPFEILVNGVVIGTINNSDLITGQWVTSTFTYNSGTDTTANFQIRNLSSNGTGNDFGIDNISFVTTPLTLSNIATSTIDIVAANVLPPSMNLDPNNSGGGADDGGFTGNFTEDGPAAPFADIDLNIDDNGQGNLTSLLITVTGVQDGANEVVTIAGAEFALDGSSNNPQTVQVGAGFIEIAYDAVPGTFTITNAAGALVPISAVDLTNLLNAFDYRAEGDTPTAGDRQFSLVITDANSQSSTAVASVITVIPTNDAAFVGITALGSNDVVVVDMSIPNVADLLDNVPAGATVIQIPVGSNGVSGLAAALAGMSNVGAIHILSHGTSGEFNLGIDAVNTNSINGTFAADLAAIGSVLSATGDILIYGCEFGADVAAVTALGVVTSADIAASDDDTGSAALGGDWVLEVVRGDIEASQIAAENWQGILAPFSISASGSPSVSGSGVGMTVIWTNAGTLGAQSIDLVATVVAFSGSSNPTFSTVGDDPSIRLSSVGEVTLRWEIFESGTGQTVSASGDVNMQIADIDGTGGVIDTREAVSADLTNLTSYTLETPTNLQASSTPAGVHISGTENESGDPVSMVGLDWANVSSWDITYNFYGNAGGARFNHDGDGDLSFNNPVTTSVNQPPVPTTTNYSTPEDIPVALTGISVSDPDAGGLDVEVTLSVTDGIIDLDDSIAGGVNAGQITGNGSDTIVITGSLAEINATLAALNGVVFTPPLDDSTDQTLTIAIDDLGNTGIGGNQVSSTTANIIVTPVNDAPVLDLDGDDSSGVVGDGFQNTFTEDGGPIAAIDSDVSITDVDDTEMSTVVIAVGGLVDGADEILTIGGTPIVLDTAFNGIVTVGGASFLTVYTPGTGNISITNSGGGDMPIADVEALLASITYENTSQDPTTGNRTLAVRVNDGDDDSNIATSTITVVPVNDPPVAVDDTNTTDEDSALFTTTANGVIDLNDTDPEGDTLIVSAMNGSAAAVDTQTSLVSGAFVTLNADGSYVYDPNGAFEALAAGATTTDSFTYEISDGNGGTDTATVTITITGLNDAPVADDEIEVTDEDVPVTIDVLDGDIDVDGTLDPASVVIEDPAAPGIFVTTVTEAGIGTWAVDTNAASPTFGQITFTPEPDYFGPVTTITYRVADNDGATTTATVGVVVNGTADAPVAVSETFTTLEDTPLTGAVLANDSDPDGDTLTVASATVDTDGNGTQDALPLGTPTPLTDNGGNQIGSITLASTGLFTFTPALDYNGPVPQITYIVDDGNGGTDTSTLDITVTPVNDAPVLDLDDDDSSGATIGDFQNTFTEDGGPVAAIDADISITDIDDTEMISAVINVSGLADGADEILTIGGTPFPLDTTVINVIISVGGTTFNILYDAGTGNFVISRTGGGMPIAALEALLASITYENTSQDPTAGNRTLAVRVNDGDDDSNIATSTIAVVPVNDPPVAVDDTGSTDEDTVLTTTAATGLINPNDTDPDAADTLVISEVNGNAADVGTQITLASGALLTVNADGSYDYDPNGQFESLATGDTATETFTYQVSDGNGGTDIATATITINGVSDPILLTNDADGSSTAPVNDYVTTYIENALAVSIVDTDSAITDSEDDIVEMVVTLTNGLQGDTISFPSILPGNISVAVVPLATLTGPGTITLTFTGDASTTLANWNSVMQSMTFLPSTHDVHDPDPADRNITFQVTDATNIASNITNTIIQVTPQNDPPTLDLDDDDSGGINAGNYQGTFIENSGGTPIHSNILMTDLDSPNLQTAIVTLTNPQANDEFTINGTAVVSGDTGTVNGINYVVSTGGGGEIIISWSGDASIADYDAALQSVSFNNTSDNPDATQRVITVVANDGMNDSPIRTAFIDVTPVNDPPVPVDPLTPGVPPVDPNDVIPNQNEVDGSAITSLDVSGYFADPDDNILTYSLGVGAPAWMSIDNATGLIDGTPPADASQNSNVGSAGQYDVVVIATDPAGLTGQTTASFLITNPVPIAEDDAVTGDEDTVVTGDLFADNGSGIDNDPDGDVITVSEVDGGAANVATATAGGNGGLFTINADGTYSFDPGTDFNDLAVGETRDTTIMYQISDGEGGFDTAVVTVTVDGANDAPVPVDPTDPTGPADPLDYIPGQTGDDGVAVTPFDLTPYFGDPDINDAITLLIALADLPVGMSFDPLTNIISGTPDADASQNGDPGTPGIYTIPVTVTDPSGATFTTNVIYTITNPAPVAEGDALSIGEDGPALNGSVLTANGTAVGLVGDVDPDGDTLTVSEVNGVAADVGQPIAGSNGGVFTINADGSYSFDPGADFQDLDIGDQRTTTISYQISDGQGGFDTATVTVTVDGANDAPNPVDPTDPTGPADPNDYIPAQSGIDNQLLTPFDITPYFADVDSGDVVSYVSLDIPAWLTLDPNTGVITGTPPADASQNGPNSDGQYPFTIVASDGTDTFSTVLVYDVGNLPPDAVDDGFTAGEDTVLNVPVGTGVIDSNDTDGDGDPLTVTQLNGVALVSGSVVTLPSGALLTLNDDGSFDYDPNGQFDGLGLGETGTDTFSYQIGDGDGLFDTATVTMTIDGANDGPIPVDPTQPPIDPLNPPAGTPFDPQTPFMPPVDPLDYIPGQTGDDGAAVTPLDLTPYFGDPDSPDAVTLSIPPADLPAGLTFDPLTNTISGTPASNASQNGDPGAPGTYTIPVTATDPNGATFTTNLVFTMSNPVPVVTVAIPDQEGVDGFDITIDTAPHFEDPDGDDLSYAAVGLPTGLTIDPLTGLISGTLDGNASNGGPNSDGFYSVMITVDDGEGGTVTTTFIFDANPMVVNIPVDIPSEPPFLAEIFDEPPIGGTGLTVADAVNGITSLGSGTALGSDGVITNAVNGIRSLGGGMGLDSDQPVGEAIRNQIETDRETGHGVSIYGREGLTLEGPTLYLGGQIDTGLHSSRGDITLRTMVHQGHMYVDLMTFGNAPLKEWSVRMGNGERVPGWINMPGSNLILIEQVADVDRINLNIIAHLKTGETVIFPVRLDMVTGEVVLRDRAYQTSNSTVEQTNSTASATPLSDEITRLANAGGDATRALFNT